MELSITERKSCVKDESGHYWQLGWYRDLKKSSLDLLYPRTFFIRRRFMMIRRYNQNIKYININLKEKGEKKDGKETI